MKLNNEQRIRLAELCGYKLTNPELGDDISQGQWLLYQGEKPIMFFEDWNPETNPGQAINCIQAWLNADDYRSYSAYCANYSQEHRVDLEITDESGTKIVGTGVKLTLKEAIIEALLEILEG